VKNSDKKHTKTQINTNLSSSIYRFNNYVFAEHNMDIFKCQKRYIV